MATATLVRTFTGTDAGFPNNFVAGALPAFTGPFTINATRTGSTANSMQLDMRFADAGGAICFSQLIAFAGGGSSFSMTPSVGTPTGAWSCTNWTTWGLRYNSLQFTNFPVGETLTVTLTYTPPPPPIICQYGTRPTSSAPAIALITDTLVAAACTAFGAPWLAVLFAPIIGAAIDTGALCAIGPPPLPPVSNGSLLGTFDEKFAQLESVIWYSLCECTPGTLATNPYVPPTITEPPKWPPPEAYTCSNSDICTTLTLILKRLDELSTAVNVTVNETNNNATNTTNVLDAVTAQIGGPGSIVEKTIGELFSLIPINFSPTVSLTHGVVCTDVDLDLSLQSIYGITLVLTSWPADIKWRTPDEAWSLRDLAVLTFTRDGNIIQRHGIHTQTHTIAPIPEWPVPWLGPVPTAIQPIGLRVHVEFLPGVCGELFASQYPV